MDSTRESTPDSASCKRQRISQPSENSASHKRQRISQPSENPTTISVRSIAHSCHDLCFDEESGSKTSNARSENVDRLIAQVKFMFTTPTLQQQLSYVFIKTIASNAEMVGKVFDDLQNFEVLKNSLDFFESRTHSNNIRRERSHETPYHIDLRPLKAYRLPYPRVTPDHHGCPISTLIVSSGQETEEPASQPISPEFDGQSDMSRPQSQIPSPEPSINSHNVLQCPESDQETNALGENDCTTLDQELYRRKQKGATWKDLHEWYNKTGNTHLTRDLFKKYYARAEKRLRGDSTIDQRDLLHDGLIRRRAEGQKWTDIFKWYKEQGGVYQNVDSLRTHYSRLSKEKALLDKLVCPSQIRAAPVTAGSNNPTRPGDR